MSQLLRFSYYFRIQVSFLLLILLPIILVSFSNYSHTKSNVNDKIKLSNDSILSIMAKDMTKMLDDLSFASNFFMQDRSVLEQLRNFRDLERITSSADADNYYQIKSFFGNVSAKTMNSDILMFLVNEQGFIVQSSDFHSPDQIIGNCNTLNPLIDKDQKNQIQWLGTVKTNKETVYYLARMIRDPVDNSQLATLFIGISDRYFEALFQQISTGRFALFDAGGRLISGSPDISLEQTKEASANVRSETLIPRTGWTLVYETPKEEVTGEISRRFYLSLATVLPFFLLFLGISVLIARRLHRPIRLLQRGVKRFGEGYRNIRFQADSLDEIGELGRTLNEMLDQINRLIANIEQEQEQKRVFELQALFAQIRPHFLLNTLNSIKCNLALADDDVHSRQIDALMSLLRSYMKINEPSTLESECRLLVYYMDIMQMRNDIKIDLDIDLPPELATMEMPRLLLQPLVENVFVHGITEESVNPRISIFANRTVEGVDIRIADNGAGMTEERLMEINAMLGSKEDESTTAWARIGLANVLQRLRLTFGAKAAMQLSHNDSGGITVVLSLAYNDKGALM